MAYNMDSGFIEKTRQKKNTEGERDGTTLVHLTSVYIKISRALGEYITLEHIDSIN